MAIGLKRGEVALYDHEIEWELNATKTIDKLKEIFGDVAVDIQHIGSTSIVHIKAKPIIDITVAVRDFDDVLALSPILENEGFFFRGWEGKERQPVFQCGEYVSGEKDMRLLTHYIHIIKADSQQWHNYINFRDYMNACPTAANKYEALKLSLAKENKDNGDLHNYHMGKQDYISEMIQIARLWDDFGRRFIKIEPISKGMSSDQKYYIETADDKHLLLRVADVSEYDRKKEEFEIMQRVSALGVPMPQPVDFGACNGGKSVYTLLSWVDGEEVEEVLPLLSDTEQYVLGIKSGEILRKIHALTAPEDSQDWATRYFAVMDERLDAFRSEGVRFHGDSIILEYLEKKRHLLKNRPQCRHHSDYHEGNMILTKDGELHIIDWHTVDFDNYGDPWYEFNRVDCNYPAFSTGQINGYFDGKPPEEFWILLAYYQAAGAITSIVWAKYFAPHLLEEKLEVNADVLRWYDNFQNLMPTWYLKDFYIQYIDDIPYKLKAPFDFSFISKYGKVFKVFDEQRSGNICFGIEEDGKRYFIKFSGAPTVNYNGSPEEIIGFSKDAATTYRTLAHQNLINMVEAEKISGGFIMVFNWTDAECAGRDYPESRTKFMALKMKTKIKIFEDVMDFHAHVAKQGYVAIDFYDGSIMYDFSQNKTVICDIDLYQKSPYVGWLGRWGSASFVSPEEVTQGAVMDEITTVHTMGQTAFALFTESDRSPEKWPLDMKLYEVVKKATSNDRNERQQSIEQLINEWRAAK